MNQKNYFFTVLVFASLIHLAFGKIGDCVNSIDDKELGKDRQKSLQEYLGLTQEEKDNKLFTVDDVNRFVQLVESGANINATNNKGLTPLYTTKNREIFAFLLYKKETVVTLDREVPRAFVENPEIISLMEPLFLEKRWRQNTYAGKLYTFLEPVKNFIARAVPK